MRLAMTDWRLFLAKTASVLVLTALVAPLVLVKGGIPATAYLIGLVVLHVIVLALYVYRVRFRQLDPDARSLAMRIGALVAVGYLLAVVSRFDGQTPTSSLLAQLAAVFVLHTVVLALLMTKRLPSRPLTALATDPGDG